MAERSAVSSKLKLVLSYPDEYGETRSKSVLMRNLVVGADAASVITVREVVENEITG